MMRKRVIMINGKIGAGKTTVAKLIADTLPAFRISHDELLVAAYGPSISPNEFRVCCERINRITWQTVARLVALPVPVVLEGWGSRQLRDSAREELKAIGVTPEFVYVTCSKELRRQRVERRNRDLKGEGFFISAEEFARIDALDEDIGEDELFIYCENDSNDRPPNLAFLKAL